MRTGGGDRTSGSGRVSKSSRGRCLRRWLLGLAGAASLGVLLLVLPLRGPVQPTRLAVPYGPDSVRIVAGERYRAGPVKRTFLGSHYRELWTEALVVEALRLDRFDGGLWPVREGGGRETRSLHLVSDSGRRWVFRSADKELIRLLPSALSRSLVAWMVQDQVSGLHPAGVLVAASLQNALGLPTAEPRLVALPDQERLGSFRPRFAGLLGTLQEAPGGGQSDSGLRPGTVPWKTSEVLAVMDSGLDHRVDGPSFLTARLLDFLLNDWDRHPGQWWWTPVEKSWGTLWRPVPVDRDQALSWYDGVLVRLVRVWVPGLTEFGPEYPDLRGLIHNSREIDRRFLVGLSRREWDSVTGFVRTRLTDSVIDAAVRRMPEPWWRASGPMVAAALKQRRDRLPQVADRFYRFLH